MISLFQVCLAKIPWYDAVEAGFFFSSVVFRPNENYSGKLENIQEFLIQQS